MHDHPNISIIIPIYNSSQYLDECIEGIINQDYTDFEAILIDDGSNDDSYEICCKWAKRDERLLVTKQNNAGASAARNRGLELARGNWIIFVDSDDKVKPNYIEDLYREVQKDDSIIIAISGVSVYRNGYWSKNLSFPDLVTSINDYQTLFTNICLHKYGFPFGKIYKSSIIKHHAIKFDEKVCIAEDMMFMINYLIKSFQHSKKFKIAFINCCNYCYQIHAGSLSTSVSSFQQEYYCYNKYKETITWLIESFNVDNNCIISLMPPIVFYIDRCLNAIYKMKSRSARLHALKIINIDEYKKYKKCHTLFEQFLYSLLSTQHFHLYDLTRQLVSLFKKK